MKRLLTTATLVLAMPAYYYSQVQEASAPQVMVPDNVKYEQQVDYVFGADFFTGKPELKNNFILLLRNRVELRHEVAADDEKFPKISTLPLMSKINGDVQPHDPANFSAETFNPLIYGWNFFDNKVQVYRIDGTEYLLIVQPQ